MNRVKQVILWSMLLSLSGFMAGCATVQPSDKVRAEVRDAKFAKVGDTVHLYYGMSKKAKEEFCLDAVVPVYRMGSITAGKAASGFYRSKTEVGKIKVTKDLGERYIEAVVVEGSVRPGDIAMQSSSECLITDPKREM